MTAPLTPREAREAGLRFTVKPIDGKWRVYDVELGSFPYAREGLGPITQDVSQAEAQAEADQLNELMQKMHQQAGATGVSGSSKRA